MKKTKLKGPSHPLKFRSSTYEAEVPGVPDVIVVVWGEERRWDWRIDRAGKTLVSGSSRAGPNGAKQGAKLALHRLLTPQPRAGRSRSGRVSLLGGGKRSCRSKGRSRKSDDWGFSRASSTTLESAED